MLATFYILLINPSMSKKFDSITSTVGNTPLVKINNTTAGLNADIFVKCEFFNPLSSVKDRIGKAMIEAAERALQLPHLQEVRALRAAHSYTHLTLPTNTEE